MSAKESFTYFVRYLRLVKYVNIKNSAMAEQNVITYVKNEHTMKISNTEYLEKVSSDNAKF